MADETPNRPDPVRDPGGGAEGSAGEQSPLQARAAFLANWDWESVIRHNRGVCERGRAQHGTNSESFTAVGEEWQQRRRVEATLGETLDYLRACHRRAPFLFFNGNTFADIARTFSDYLFAELQRLVRCHHFTSICTTQETHTSSFSGLLIERPIIHIKRSPD